MFLFLIRKLFLVVVTLIILSLISYQILGRNPQFVAESGYIAGYFDYVERLLSGDWGMSAGNEPLVAQIIMVFPATMLLCLSASLFSLVLGIPFGFLASVKSQTLLGRLLKSLSRLGLAVPVFWLAIVLQASLSMAPTENLDGFLQYKTSHYFQSWENFAQMGQQLLLPTLILAIPATLEVVRMTQQRTSYVLKQNYVKVARTRGWSPLKVWCTHILGNTLPPLIPSIARNITLIFAFGMLIENVVSWSGIGRWMINALSQQDYNAISAGVLAIGMFVLAVDFIANFITIVLDPNHKKDWYEKA